MYVNFVTDTMNAQFDHYGFRQKLMTLNEQMEKTEKMLTKMSRDISCSNLSFSLYQMQKKDRKLTAKKYIYIYELEKVIKMIEIINMGKIYDCIQEDQTSKAHDLDGWTDNYDKQESESSEDEDFGYCKIKHDDMPDKPTLNYLKERCLSYQTKTAKISKEQKNLKKKIAQLNAQISAFSNFIIQADKIMREKM